MNQPSSSIRVRLAALVALAIAVGAALAVRYNWLPISDLQRMQARGALFVRNEEGDIVEARLEGPRFSRR